MDSEIKDIKKYSLISGILFAVCAAYDSYSFHDALGYDLLGTLYVIIAMAGIAAGVTFILAVKDSVDVKLFRLSGILHIAYAALKIYEYYQLSDYWGAVGSVLNLFSSYSSVVMGKASRYIFTFMISFAVLGIIMLLFFSGKDRVAPIWYIPAVIWAIAGIFERFSGYNDSGIEWISYFLKIAAFACVGMCIKKIAANGNVLSSARTGAVTAVGMNCSKCGKPVSSDSEFCRNCGAPINRNAGSEDIHVFCSACGTPVEADAAFCPKCGKPIT